jgi:rod shape-determining protein MreC
VGSKQKTFVTLTALIVVFFLLEITGVVNLIEAPLQRIFLPAQIALNKTRIDFSNFIGTISDIKSLREKETQTANENAILTAENARLKRLKKENQALRQQLKAPKISQELIAATVIGQDPLLSSSKLLIDRGKTDRIELGNLVILKDILIGEVVVVGDSTSTVRLLSDSETKIPAETEKGVRGILRGQFGNQIVLEKVTQDKKLTKGDIVFSSGEADMPKGLVLGQIIKVESSPAEIFQKAIIEPLTAYENLETVFVVEGTKQ